MKIERDITYKDVELFVVCELTKGDKPDRDYPGSPDHYRLWEIWADGENNILHKYSNEEQREIIEILKD